jgi:hypothetical protein
LLVAIHRQAFVLGISNYAQMCITSE